MRLKKGLTVGKSPIGLVINLECYQLGWLKQPILNENLKLAPWLVKPKILGLPYLVILNVINLYPTVSISSAAQEGVDYQFN
jgi:hypothetical protein